MTPGLQIFLSGTLTFGVPLALAVRDLLTMRRSSGDGGWRPEPPAPDLPKPIDGGDPARPALPACLIEAAKGRPLPSRAREFEFS